MNPKDWPTKIFDYDGSDVIYIGYNKALPDDADEGATDWAIKKVVYSSGNITYILGPLIGEWDERVGLAWS